MVTSPGITDDEVQALKAIAESTAPPSRVNVEAPELDDGDTKPLAPGHKNKVTVGMCEKMRDLRDDGYSYDAIASKVGVAVHDTVAYHVTGECQHDEPMYVTRDQCGFMRVRADQGMSTGEIADEYPVTRRSVTSHVTGDCSHDLGIQPVDSSTLRSNAQTESKTEATCAYCGGEFRHPRWQDRRFCSVQCAGKFPRVDMEESVCKNCQNTFAHKSYRDREYCSQECQRRDSPGYDRTTHCPKCGGFVTWQNLEDSTFDKISCGSCGLEGVGPCPSCETGALLVINGGMAGLQAFRCLSCKSTETRYRGDPAVQEADIAR